MDRLKTIITGESNNLPPPVMAGVTTQQPQPMGGGQMGAAAAPMGININLDDLYREEELKERRWYAGFCGCCDNLPGCIAAFFCPWCYLCYVYRIYSESVVLPIFCPTKALWALRLYVRGLGRITGGICEDWFLVRCCFMCVLSQLQREYVLAFQIDRTFLVGGL